ncbi:hypothetical protein PJ985_13365 [Streptomyces sp. ACA25]|uniref:hypothetical protein n=1 Tax=Streptomyces sp. ACA25 TaxID=3022596 RepID=UPI0023074809|nr:hypothetical protein [Streptomyces sp. ACA25]MDB1088557.1 hypothetical protein [Streptomyces sp. ACA25]
MGCTRAMREGLRQATRAPRAAAGAPAAVGPSTAADAEAPETGRKALHGHG